MNKLSIIVLFVLCPFLLRAESAVRMWEEPLTIPTYQVGPADPNPMFYDNESYQGAQRKIYPYPLLDDLRGVKQPKTYKALYLENEYIKLCILPELGGRLFYALDKTTNYDIFYHQHVIKPALIGMLGAWISGGIEWCVFHHHRNTTFMPVDYTLANHADGSKTIWFGETERRHRMKWLIGVTLHPGASFIETSVKMFNRTPYPNSILYWANVAVHVNDDYQVIFPPSVDVATYHAKNAFTRWPVSDGLYRNTDYTGINMSWWKNHPHANSCFAWNMQEDFMGGYDHGRNAGMVHVGDHHIVGGAKLWEWGPDNIMDTQVLTDADGPYAELMVGAFSDNQPDYSWIKPFETKSFTQYWYPLRGIDGLKNANRNAAVNVQKSGRNVAVGFNATRLFHNARAIVLKNKTSLLHETIDISPSQPYVAKINMQEEAEETQLKAILLSADGDTLISYQPVVREHPKELPQEVKAPLKPEKIDNIEQLYLAGKRLQQIHNPRIDPMDYYNEILKRDPGDSRANTAVGIIYNKTAQYDKAAEHLRRAVQRLSTDYTRPEDTEALYQLGLTLKAMGRTKAAIDTFYRATWDYAFFSAAHFELAALSCAAGEYSKALQHINNSLATNQLNTKAVVVKAAILRHLGDSQKAQCMAVQALGNDPLDFFAANELYLALKLSGAHQKAEQQLSELNQNMRGEVQSYLELAFDYMGLGFWKEADDVLQRAAGLRSFAGTFPMVYYCLGYIQDQLGDHARAGDYFQKASAMPSDYCFPFRAESIAILKKAIAVNPKDASAFYYLGDLLYDWQPDAAISAWEKSRDLDNSRAIVFRNLGWGYWRRGNNPQLAASSYEHAIALNGADPRYYLELDDIYERLNTPPQKRLALLEANHDVICTRKSLLIREISLLVREGKEDKAIGYLADNHFYVSEGGGGELRNAYVDAHLLKGLALQEAGDADGALAHFQQAALFPDNLSLEKPDNDNRAAQINYYAATALASQGRKKESRRLLEKCASQNISSRWTSARYFQALALQELGRDKEAKAIFNKLIAKAQANLAGNTKVDAFAKFGRGASRNTRLAEAHFAFALGLSGKGDVDGARKQMQQTLNLNAGHVWAAWLLEHSK